MKLKFIVFLAVFFLLALSARADVVWTKSFNYTGELIEETDEHVILKIGDLSKKIPRSEIESITYSREKTLSPEKRDKIKLAEMSLEMAVQALEKWRKENPRKYAKQLREEEAARKKEEEALEKHIKTERERLEKLLAEHRKEEEARKQKLREAAKPPLKTEEKRRKEMVEKRKAVEERIRRQREAIGSAGLEHPPSGSPDAFSAGTGGPDMVPPPNGPTYRKH